MGLKLLNSVANGVPNRFEFQGHEKESTFGLNRVDFGARNYNPTIGRFDRVDALADVTLAISPFVYNLNNPARFTDPDGNSSEDFTYSDGYSNLSEKNITGNVAFSGY